MVEVRSFSVTTTFGIPLDDNNDEVHKREFYARMEHGPGHVDGAQKKVETVENYRTNEWRKWSKSSPERTTWRIDDEGDGGRVDLENDQANVVKVQS